jgi:hypothetical protein
MTKYIQRLVNLELPDFQIVRKIAVESGLGGKDQRSLMTIPNGLARDYRLCWFTS